VCSVLSCCIVSGWKKFCAIGTRLHCIDLHAYVFVSSSVPSCIVSGCTYYSVDCQYQVAAVSGCKNYCVIGTKLHCVCIVVQWWMALSPGTNCFDYLADHQTVF
jgi:hypothetical protein